MRRRRTCFACDHRWTTFEVGADFLDAVRDLDKLVANIRAFAKQVDDLLANAPHLTDFQGSRDDE